MIKINPLGVSSRFQSKFWIDDKCIFIQSDAIRYSKLVPLGSGNNSVV